MVVEAVRLNVSVPKSHDEFLTEHNLSPSALMQFAIEQKMQQFNDFKNERDELLRKMINMRNELQARIEFITQKGLMDEWDKWADDRRTIR